jgi:two-component system cell cycle response regulator DivK
VDNPVNVELMLEMLSPERFDVSTCNDGREVMRLAKAHRPSLILLDINLPNIDGLTLARMLRQNTETRATTILAVSACAMAGDEERMLKAGCVGSSQSQLTSGPSSKRSRRSSNGNRPRGS